MIIWGSKAREFVEQEGSFFCPVCRKETSYQLKRLGKYFTLYYMPLFQIKDLGRFVECKQCKNLLKEEVLNYQHEQAISSDPGKEEESLFSSVAELVQVQMLFTSMLIEHELSNLTEEQKKKYLAFELGVIEYFDQLMMRTESDNESDIRVMNFLIYYVNSKFSNHSENDLRFWTDALINGQGFKERKLGFNSVKHHWNSDGSKRANYFPGAFLMEALGIKPNKSPATDLDQQSSQSKPPEDAVIQSEVPDHDLNQGSYGASKESSSTIDLSSLKIEKRMPAKELGDEIGVDEHLIIAKIMVGDLKGEKENGEWFVLPSREASSPPSEEETQSNTNQSHKAKQQIHNQKKTSPFSTWKIIMLIFLIGGIARGLFVLGHRPSHSDIMLSPQVQEALEKFVIENQQSHSTNGILEKSPEAKPIESNLNEGNQFLQSKGQDKAEVEAKILEMLSNPKQDHTEEMKWFREKADQGNLEAQKFLGFAYYYGGFLKQNYTEAAKWLQKVKEQGDAEVQNVLGAMYAQGQGVERDDAEAVKMWRKAAAQGLAAAQYNLGAMYIAGRGVKPDYVEAAKWFHKAAEQGDAGAENTLGNMYMTGFGVEKNYVEAVRWYRKAADQGFVKAQLHLGQMYAAGRGVKQSNAEAKIWFSKAAKQGNADAKSRLEQLNKKEKREAKSEILPWKAKAPQKDIQVFDASEPLPWKVDAIAGQAKQCQELYREKQFRQAFPMCKKAAEGGNAEAQYVLGLMYEKAQGVKKDYAEAVKWLKKADRTKTKQSDGNIRLDNAFKSLISNIAATGDASTEEWKLLSADEGYILLYRANENGDVFLNHVPLPKYKSSSQIGGWYLLGGFKVEVQHA
jgi:hypothetical protein